MVSTPTPGRTRILITGDRHWENRRLAREIVRRLVERYGSNIVIVHGGGCDIDQAFSVACQDLRIPVEAHPVTDDWIRRYGAEERPLRNKAMVELGADLCIAVHRYLVNSTGAKDCVRQALAAGIPVYLIDSAAVRPRRIQAGTRGCVDLTMT
jgi:acetylglutamate kinase